MGVRKQKGAGQALLREVLREDLALAKRLSGTPLLSAAQTLLNSLGGITLIILFRFLSQEQKFYCEREFQEYNKLQIADFHRT